MNGTVNFEYEIERYLDKDSGELLTFDSIKDINDFEFEHQYILLEIEGYSNYTAAYLASWENSTPSEGETEIVSVLGPNNADWLYKLTTKEHDSILEMVDEHAREF